MFKLKVRSGVGHLEFILLVWSYSIPLGKLDSVFEDLSNDVSFAMLYDV